MIHTNKQECNTHTQKNNKSIQTIPEEVHMLDLLDKDFK